jgi:ribosome biogenesis GTPase A
MPKVQSLITEYNENNNAYYYVAGRTNTGKSTFVNKLARATWDIPHSKFKKLELTDTLTTSDIRGTTLGVVPVKLRRLGLKIRDTPGIPFPESLGALFAPRDGVQFVHSKQIVPKYALVHKGQYLSLGQYASIKLVGGEYFHAAIFASTTVSRRVLEEPPTMITEETTTHTIEVPCSTV